MAAGPENSGGTRRIAVDEAAQMVLAKHPSVIPSREPQLPRKPARRADGCATTIGVRNIARLLAR